MIVVQRRFHFCASHRYYVPEWSYEENLRFFGKTINEHGHNYTLFVSVYGGINRYGMLINISELKLRIGSIIDELYDHRNLNMEHPFFKDKLPTTENLVRSLWKDISDVLDDGLKLYKLRLWEGKEIMCEYEGKEEVILTREYRFSAGHRLYLDGLTDEENYRIYGKCANPNGHGHDYVLRVSVKGKVDSTTGFVVNVSELDRIVKEVLEEIDHKFLNRDVDYFKDKVPTTEHLLMYIYSKLNPKLPNIHRIEIQETENNVFTLYPHGLSL